MHIVIVDDEPAVCESLSRTLRFEGYRVSMVHDGDHALELIRSQAPDGVILDVMMPGRNGYEVCRALRARGDLVPVLMLTARVGVTEAVTGLDAGADDYLEKPFALQELLARVRAMLRRAPAALAGEVTPGRGFADLFLDPVTREVNRSGRRISLTRTEFSLLEVFLAHPRMVLTRAVLFDQVWGYGLAPSSNGVDVHVGLLRRKLESGGEPRLLHTVRGVGYVLREEPR